MTVWSSDNIVWHVNQVALRSGPTSTCSRVTIRGYTTLRISRFTKQLTPAIMSAGDGYGGIIIG